MDDYLTRIVERDAPDVSNLQRLDELPRILRVLAARNSGELNPSDVANLTGIPVRTLDPRIQLLETLYLIQRIPAWSTNLTKRAVSRPKVTLLDSGLAARLLGVSAEGAETSIGGQMAGSLLEGFVAGELRRQLGWSEAQVRLSHFRDRNGDEVDLILESDDGAVAGLEIKSNSSVGPRDARWLIKLRDHLGSKFVGGLVLHAGRTSAPMGDRIAAVPIDTIWTA